MGGCCGSERYGCTVVAGSRPQEQLELELVHAVARDSGLGATVAGCVSPKRIARCVRSVAGVRRGGESESC